MRTLPFRRKILRDANAVDWKDNPEEVLNAVSLALERFGLEIVLYDYPGDSYVFAVAKRESKNEKVET